MRSQRPSSRDGKRRILVATHTLSTGGAQRWLGDVLLRAPSGVLVTVLAASGGRQVAELERAGCEVLVIGQPSADSVDAYEGHLALLAAWLSTREPFDGVLINTVGMYPVADLATRIGLPTVWAVHESYDMPVYWAVAHPAGINPHVRLCAERAMRESARVLFVADSTRLQYEQWFGPLPGFETIGGAVDPDRFALPTGEERADARARLGLPSEPAPVVLCLGSVEPRKGQTSLARAFLRATDGTDAVLAIVGPDPGEPYGSSLRAFLASADTTGRVRVDDETSDVIGWLRAADVLVSASDVESLPLVILEAMAAGTPVLATSVFGVPELVSDGETGWLVPANDEEALVEGIRRVLSSTADERRRIVTRARDRVARHNDLRVYVPRLWEILDSLTTASARVE